MHGEGRLRGVHQDAETLTECRARTGDNRRTAILERLGRGQRTKREFSERLQIAGDPQRRVGRRRARPRQEAVRRAPEPGLADGRTLRAPNVTTWRLGTRNLTRASSQRSPQAPLSSSLPLSTRPTSATSLRAAVELLGRNNPVFGVQVALLQTNGQSGRSGPAAGASASINRRITEDEEGGVASPPGRRRRLDNDLHAVPAVIPA